MGVTGGDDSTLLGPGLWLAAGAGLGTLAGWAVAAGTALTTPVGLGVGFALGGGLGVALPLTVLEETEPRPPESVTVETTSHEGPRPADLFEAHPDPLLYYADEGSGPVVRAVNDAFAETFGVAAETLVDTPLDEVPGAASTPALVEAAAAGETFDAGIELAAGQFRARVAAVAEEAGTTGYVVFTPVD
ncbi:hypothetical protein BRD09_06170 [Halobacteriales archaeon SW_10_68_16]|jgi:hypothetical protein|nr:MAG: hypothetical protein BRD09_06170 [Halobacteriales archaeon SW_10_68_16]